MAIKPFTPKREDGRPQWQVVYDIAAAAELGDTITYKRLEDELETKDRKVIYRAAAKANEHLWETASRSLEVSPDLGYRVLLPQEHEAQATRYQKQSRRKLTMAIGSAIATDLAKLPTEEARNRVVAFATGLVLMAQAVDAHEKKLARHDEMFAKIHERMDRMERDKKR